MISGKLDTYYTQDFSFLLDHKFQVSSTSSPVTINFYQQSNYPKECHCAAAFKSSKANFRLSSQVLGILNRCYHTLNSQECCQICRVR